MRKWVYRTLTILLLLVLLGSGGYLLWKHLDYQRGIADYSAALEAAGLPLEQEKPVSAPDQSGASGQEEEEDDPYMTMLAETDLDALREINPDIIGWILIPETNLSYPITQGENNQYYLNHTWQGTRNAMGAIFMEQTCSPDFSDFNTIIYGHRMNNETMFGTLRGYQNPDFWREHPSVYIMDAAAVRRYEIFAAGEPGIRDIVYRLDLEENNMQQEFIDFCLEHSQIDTNIVPTAEDQILTLSTCTSRGHATRWVVQGVLQKVSSR